MQEPASQKESVCAVKKEVALESRMLLMTRRLPPNSRVCAPLVQAISSTRLCTGTVVLRDWSLRSEVVETAEVDEVLRLVAKFGESLTYVSIAEDYSGGSGAGRRCSRQ